MKNLSIVLSVLAAVFLTGCTSIINTPQGKIASITERGIGLEVAQAPANQSPEVKFGFFSSAVVFIPTSESNVVHSANFANTFDFTQSGVLNMGIGENIASGAYQTYSPGTTNSAISVNPLQATNAVPR